MKSKGPGTWGWGIGFLVGLGLVCMSSSTDVFAGVIYGSKEGDLTLTLHIYDYAQVAPSDLARAKEEATGIFRVVGLETTWHERAVSAEGPQGEACRRHLGPDVLVLRILPRLMAERVPLNDSTFGFAMQSTDGRPAYVANVFYHRVERLAADLGFPRGVILGDALAHEIGHLLLGTHSHAPFGIMRASWTRRDLINASMGGLLFLPPAERAHPRRGAVEGAGEPHAKGFGACGRELTKSRLLQGSLCR